MSQGTPNAKRIFGSESEHHFKAKTRLARWLHAAAKRDDGPPAYRVIIEYPFSEWGDGVKAWSASGFDRKPTWRQLRAHGMPVFCICDIALVEGDKVTTAVEVVHSHYTPPWKVAWLRKHGISVFEANASAILMVRERAPSFDDLLIEVTE